MWNSFRFPNKASLYLWKTSKFIIAFLKTVFPLWHQLETSNQNTYIAQKFPKADPKNGARKKHEQVTVICIHLYCSRFSVSFDALSFPRQFFQFFQDIIFTGNGLKYSLRHWLSLISKFSTKAKKNQIYLKSTYSKSCLFFSFFFFPFAFWGSCSLAAPAPSISAAKASRSISSLALKWKQRRPKCYSRPK